MEMLRDEDGKPLSRWDGETMKLHPITGEEIPDPDAKMELYEYVNPRRAEWPQVEFIVGNPPFIGGKDMRAELGDGYAEAAWKVRKDVPGGADFVMHFWDEAATRLLAKPPKGAKGENPLRRFGFITTNHPDFQSPRGGAAHERQAAAIAGLCDSRSPLAEGERQGGGAHRDDRRRAR